MKEISGSTWIIIILFVIFIIIINVWLFSYPKGKKTKRTVMVIRDSMNVLKNPFQEEDKKLEELANLTNRFKEKDDDTQKGDGNAK